MMRLATIVAATCISSTAYAWDKELWDPGEPFDGQLELSLPCGGKITFAQVQTPVDTNDPLADREIRIGSTTASSGYLDFFRRDHVRGGFNEGGDSFYYIAKYEVTRDQWAAVMGDCPEPSVGGSRPKGDLSWFDGIEFTRRLSEYLALETPDELPTEDGVRGHVRLPSEAEWEFAARGGAAVDLTTFRAELPILDGDISDYAWFAGRSSSNGSYRPIGRKQPNPLGIYDMIGSVEELVLDPFRLNNLGRLHGQVGGYITRGGSIENEDFELSSATRAEWPFFDPETGAATKIPSAGLRPVISVQVNTSLGRSTLIRDIWLERWANDDQLEENPLSVIDALAERVTDKQILQELAHIRSEIISERRARDEATAAAMRLSLSNGATLMQWIKGEKKNIARREGVVARLSESLTEIDPEAEARDYRRSQKVLQKNMDDLQRSLGNYDLSTSIYLETLIRLDENHTTDDLAAQKDILIIELDERGPGWPVPIG